MKTHKENPSSRECPETEVGNVFCYSDHLSSHFGPPESHSKIAKDSYLMKVEWGTDGSCSSAAGGDRRAGHYINLRNTHTTDDQWKIMSHNKTILYPSEHDKSWPERNKTPRIFSILRQ